MVSYSHSRMRMHVRRNVLRLVHTVYGTETIDQFAQIPHGTHLRNGLSAIYRADNFTVDQADKIIPGKKFKETY